MRGEKALEYVDFYDFSRDDDQPEILRSELLHNSTDSDENFSSTDVGELILPSGATIGLILFQ